MHPCHPGIDGRHSGLFLVATTATTTAVLLLVFVIFGPVDGLLWVAEVLKEEY